MKLNPILSLLLVISSSYLTGCSEGGGGALAVPRCEATNPIPMEVPSGQNKLDLSNVSTDLPMGKYVRTKVDFYYEDGVSSTADSFHFQAQEVAQKDGSFKMEWTCVRNRAKQPDQLTVSVKAATEMLIDARGVESTISEYGFHIDDKGSIVVDGQAKPGEKPSLPDIYAGASEKFLLKSSDTEFEIRSTGPKRNQQGAIQGNYYLSVKYKRQ